jgi:hypothetical protein
VRALRFVLWGVAGVAGLGIAALAGLATVVLAHKKADEALL